MGGKNKKITTGYHYRPAWHDGLCLGDLDAYLEFRPGTKTAWAGRITTSTTLNINEPDLWGGEKDQGGVVGPMSVMFGEADQLPNAYLTSVFGNQTVAWRGIATVAFEGGRYGANNPFPQKRAHKVERIKKGWDDDAYWYPEKAAVPVLPGVEQDIPNNDPNWKYLVVEPGSTLDASGSVFDDSGWATGPGGFGNGGPGAGLGVGTYVPAGVFGRGIWIRRVLNAIPGTPISTDVWHDDGAWLWFNGVEVPIEPTADYYHGTALIDGALVSASNVVALKVLDSIPGGSPSNIYAGLDIHLTAPVVGTLLAENPAHAIIWAHTQQHCGGMPLETINSASAQAAADWYFAQGFGICTIRYPDKESAAEFIRRIERVAGCSFSQNRADGQWYIDIANGEYDVDSLPILTDDDIVSFEEVPSVLDDAVNSVSIKYFDPQRKEAIATPPLRAMGLVAEFGTIHQTFDFPEIPTDALANRVSAREGRALGTPTRVFNLVTTRKTAGWRRNTYFRLQLPKRGIADMVCLLAEVNGGSLKSGAVQIKATQDIYSLPTTVYTETEPGVDTRPPQTPVPAIAQQVFEAPHVDLVAALSPSDYAALADDAGYAVAAAGNPGGMLDFAMRVDAGAGYATMATGDFCPVAVLSAELPPQRQTGIAVDSAAQLTGVQIGSACIINGEWCRVDAIDTGANTLALGRGCADTVPAKHAAGSLVYFYAAAAAVDNTDYIDGETIDVKLLPRTGSKQLTDADATAQPLTFARRRIRPYPPAQLQIGGVSIFELASVSAGGSGSGEGGGGEDGGGSVPSTGPAITPEGTPASTALGPNGGYADDAPYALPLPPHSPSTSLIADGDFDGTGALDGWTTGGGTPLGSEWTLEDDGSGTSNRAHYLGTGADIYYFPRTYRMPSQPLPRYDLQLSASMQAAPGMRVTAGFLTRRSDSPGSALDYQGPFDAPGGLSITKHLAGWDWWQRQIKAAPTGQHVTKTATPMVVFEKSSGLDMPSNGWLDKCYLYATKIEPATTAQVLDHLDFDDDLTGWTLQPVVDAGSPALSTTGGALAMAPTGTQRGYQNVICDDPIDLADAIGKYVGIGAEVWCDDPTVSSRVTQNGVALGIIAKDTTTGDYAGAPILGCSYQRGDFTEREVWIRVPEIADVTWHLCLALRTVIGKTAKLRALSVQVTDEVVD